MPPRVKGVVNVAFGIPLAFGIIGKLHLFAPLFFQPCIDRIVTIGSIGIIGYDEVFGGNRNTVTIDPSVITEHGLFNMIFGLNVTIVPNGQTGRTDFIAKTVNIGVNRMSVTIGIIPMVATNGRARHWPRQSQMNHHIPNLRLNLIVRHLAYQRLRASPFLPLRRFRLDPSTIVSTPLVAFALH